MLPVGCFKEIYARLFCLFFLVMCLLNRFALNVLVELNALTESVVCLLM